MKLTLEQIWKLADLLEENNQTLDNTKNIIAEKEQTKERVLKLPQLQISENWGKLNTVEREELERIVESATKGGQNPFERLTMIKNQMEQIAAGANIKNPRRIISQIILLETLNRMFKSFQPSPAGFINEAFLSVIYGSQQKAALQGNAEGDIGDITDDGIPVSLKTLSYGEKGEGPIVKGSVANLINSINLNNKVYFDIYLKNSSGAKSAVGKMEIFRFAVDAKNINQFLQLSPGTIPTDAQTGKLQLPANLVQKGLVALKEEPETEEASAPDVDRDLSEEAEKIFRNGINKLKGNRSPAHSELGKLSYDVLKANNFELPKSGEFREFVNNLNPKSLYYIIDALKQLPRSPKIGDLIKYFSGEQISKVKPSSKELESEFRVPYGHWMTFVDNYLQEKIVLEFSDEKIKSIIDNAVKSLDASITDIFNNLADFSSSLQNYLTSTQIGRGKEGEKAVELAKRLTPSTEKVVKDTAESD